MRRRLAITWLAATGVLAFVRALEMVVNARATGVGIDIGSSAYVLGLGAASAIHAALLVWLAHRSTLPDPQRIYGLVAIGVGFAVVNNVEAAVFGIASVRLLAGLGLVSAGAHAAVTLGVARSLPVRLAPPAHNPGTPVTRSRMGLRFAALAILYGIVYFAAGAVIYPFVQDFYQHKTLPSGGTTLALQVFVRGPIFVAIGNVVVRLIGATPRLSALAVACTLSGLGGLTALLTPNPLFPDSVRLVHLVEVGVSNFVFGLIVGWVLSRRPARSSDANETHGLAHRRSP